MVLMVVLLLIVAMVRIMERLESNIHLPSLQELLSHSYVITRYRHRYSFLNPNRTFIVIFIVTRMRMRMRMLVLLLIHIHTNTNTNTNTATNTYRPLKSRKYHSRHPQSPGLESACQSLEDCSYTNISTATGTATAMILILIRAFAKLNRIAVRPDLYS